MAWSFRGGRLVPGLGTGQGFVDGSTYTELLSHLLSKYMPAVGTWILPGAGDRWGRQKRLPSWSLYLLVGRRPDKNTNEPVTNRKIWIKQVE